MLQERKSGTIYNNYMLYKLVKLHDDIFFVNAIAKLQAYQHNLNHATVKNSLSKIKGRHVSLF